MTQEKTNKAESSVVSEPAAVTSTPRGEKKKNNMGLIIGLISAVFLVIVVGSVAFAYNFLYQNDEKVISDAVVNLLKSKTTSYAGEINIESGRTASSKVKIKINVSGQNDNTSNQTKIDVSLKTKDNSFKLGGEAIFAEKGDLYVKLDGAKTALKKANIYDNMKEFHKIIDKIDSNWVKIPSQDIQEFSKQYTKSQECTDKITKMITEDKQIKRELIKLYRDNQFVVIDEKLGSRDGSFGYKVKIDTLELKNALIDLKNTELYKEIKDCNDDFSLDDLDFDEYDNSDSSSDSEIVTELWISQFGHKFTNINGNIKGGEGKFSYSISPKFDTKITIETPKKSIELADLLAEINAAGNKNKKMYSYDF